jgi:hypothetical protein
MKRTITFFMILFLALSFSAPVLAKDDSSGDLSTPEVVGDLLWVRPVGFMQIALGATAFVISLPVTLPLKKTEQAREFLITYPYHYFLKRPLREM